MVYFDMRGKSLEALREVDEESCKMLDMMKVFYVFFSLTCCVSH